MLREKRAIVERRLLSGSIKTMEDYNFVIGRFKEIEELEIEVRRLYSGLFESTGRKESIEHEQRQSNELY